MTISIDENIAKDLIDHRIRAIDTRISRILTKWNYEFSDEFVSDVKSGKLDDNAIDDAMDLQNLMDERKSLVDLLEN